MKTDSLRRFAFGALAAFMLFISTFGCFVGTETLCARAEESGFEYFNELMGEYSTSYASSAAARKHNVELAAAAVNGKVVEPGEEFSFNVTVGVRSAKRGYLPAPVIINGEFTTGTGGGVCQVSTTLYNAVLRAGIAVTEVSRHSLPVSYVAYSMDAMVSEATDFRFVNDTPYPVRIEMKADGSSLKAALYGFKVYTDGISVKFEGRIVKKVSCDEYERREARNGELDSGEKERVVRAPRPGMYTEAVRSLYYRGEKVEEKVFRKDYYAPVKGLILYSTETGSGEETEPHPGQILF